MTTRPGLLGVVFRARPGLQRWHDTGIVQTGIAARWVLWLAAGWPLTTLTATAAAGVVTVTAPWLMAIAAVGVVRVAWMPDQRIASTAVALIVGAAAVWWTWTTTTWIGHALLVGPLLAWPLDRVAATFSRMEGWRRWCEFRRGFPIRWAIMAAKATRIQGFTDGERQLFDGRRPILDQPALGLIPRWRNGRAWIHCSVPPGRDHDAFAEVLNELASSFVNVARLDLVFEPHQSFGHLITTFAHPTLNPPDRVISRVGRTIAAAVPHAAVAVSLAAMTWTITT